MGEVRGGHRLPGGRHVDDRTRRPVLDHAARHRLADQEVTLEVDVQNGVPFLLADLEEGRALQDPGVVHQDVEAAQEVVRLGDEALDVRSGVGGTLHGDRPAPRRLDLTDGALGILAATAVAHRHVRTLAGQSHRDPPTDAP